MANKMTQRDYFNEIIALAKANNRADLVEFAEGRIEALDKKSANKKPSKAQAENEGLKAEVLSVLTNENITVSDLMKKSEVLAPLSNQKVTAILRMLIEEGKVVKTMDKKKSYFALASDEGADAE